ncbi:MAG TPA: diaminopimelate decarboxylase, partial [Thermoanaerobaculia bacterium]|nr:diaminopimelate decarboxylase [Thermoanaerobaculia bacterium]
MRFERNGLHIGGVSVAGLAERFGTPLYVYDAGVLRRQIGNVRRAFAPLPSFRPFYAMKANSNLAILRLVRESGFGCDAVSPGEIFLARHAGYEPGAIWFTCSNVSDEDLRAIPDPRIVINVNSMSEIDRVLAAKLVNPIALRINPDVGAGHHVDVVTAGGSVKFGIDVAEVDDARRVCEDTGHDIVGLHAHIGSGVTTLDPLLAAARCLLDLSRDFPKLRFINFGGGIASPYHPNEAEFPIDEYGRALSELVSAKMSERGLSAILEPGRYVVAESGALIARATSKRISAGVEWIGVDTGFNHLARPSKYGAYHHIVNATRGTDASLRPAYEAPQVADEAVIAGNICESG